ncbi:GNAT family N-acetyltransferase [Exiguobacterium sp.]|uniref:GNAT family N-acetyltransferase n=1 Tax=Exiguobacterium sp. TaxID=44751 RepID=UPI002898FB47|nr:GNAT family N-acetyltransferase [Exiguobacterium sp.]
MFRLQVSDHVSLQLFERHHAETLFALVDANRAHLREWLGWVDGTTDAITYQEVVIPAWLQQFADGNGFTCGIYLQEELVGTIGLHAIDRHLGQTSIGYYLGEKGLGKGVMTDVVRFVTHYCFETLGLNRVVIECVRRETSGADESRNDSASRKKTSYETPRNYTGRITTSRSMRCYDGTGRKRRRWQHAHRANETSDL